MVSKLSKLLHTGGADICHALHNAHGLGLRIYEVIDLTGSMPDSHAAMHYQRAKGKARSTVADQAKLSTPPDYKADDLGFQPGGSISSLPDPRYGERARLGGVNKLQLP